MPLPPDHTRRKKENLVPPTYEEVNKILSGIRNAKTMDKLTEFAQQIELLQRSPDTPDHIYNFIFERVIPELNARPRNLPENPNILN